MTLRESLGRRSVALLLAAMAVTLVATLAGRLAAQTICQRNAAVGAAFSVTCSSSPPLNCTFTNTSGQPAGGIAAIEWDFGDGSFAQGSGVSAGQVAHAYAAGGVYLVTMTLTAGDGQVAVATGLVALGGPAVPLAANDAFTTPRNTPLVIAIAELLSNDLPGVTFVQATKCVVSAAGDSCTYTPPANFVGVDTFTYTVADMLGDTGAATVTITVTQPLVANPDSFTVYAGSSIDISSTQLLANDTPGALFVSAQNPVNGTLTLKTTGPPVVYTFTPATGFVGTASFDYLISWDGNPPYARGLVAITVADAPPIAQFAVSCAGMTCQVHTTSYDPDGTRITRYLWDWGDGSPVVEPGPPVPWADQSHTYTVAGRYTITHTVYDPAGLSGSLQLSVLPNAPPVAANDTATTDRDVPVTIDVLANDSDPDGDVLTLANVDLLTNYPGAAWQGVQLNGRWAIKVTPPDSFVGTITFHYQACDSWGACSSPATVTLTVRQWTVIVDAIGEQFYLPQNGSLSIPLATLQANDYDSNGDPLTIVAFDTSILMGTLDCTTNPAVCSYRPPLNAAGYTLFRYTVTDPAGHHSTTTVRLYVGVVPQPPTAGNVFFTTPANTARAFTIQDVWQFDFDAGGNTLAVALTSLPAYGTIACTRPMYGCTYTPNHGFVGAETLGYTVSDGINAPVAAYLTVLTLPNPTPTFDAREVLVTVAQNQQAYIGGGVLATDYAPSGGPVVVTSLDTTGLAGSLNCTASGCTYTPPSYYLGTTSFKVTAGDSHGATDTAIVKLRVGGSDTAPVVAAQSLTTPRNTPLRFSIFDLLRGAYNANNDPMPVTVFTSGAQLGTLSCGNPSYWCTYTPNANVTGTDVVTYAVGDGATYTNSTLTITIQ
jgi:hypothetical protein